MWIVVGKKYSQSIDYLAFRFLEFVSMIQHFHDPIRKQFAVVLAAQRVLEM